MAAWTSQTLLSAIAAAPSSQCFTEADMVAATGLAAEQVESALYNLRRHGFVGRNARGCYGLLDAGREAIASGINLRSGPKGPQASGQRHRDPGLRQTVWNCLRLGRKFTIDDIVLRVCEGTERDPRSNVGKYLRALAKAGYVRGMAMRERPASGYRNQGHIRWLLVNDTGPIAPVWRASRNSIYDPNTETEIAFVKDDSPAQEAA